MSLGSHCAKPIMCTRQFNLYNNPIHWGQSPHFIKKKPRIKPVQCIVTSPNSKADVNLDCVTLKAIFPTMLLVILDFYGLSGSFENLIKATDSHLLKISIYTTVSPQLHIWTR